MFATEGFAPSFIPSPREAHPTPLLDVRDHYRFPTRDDDRDSALLGLSLQLQSGEFVAILCDSEQDRSTLLRCLVGLDEPDAGTIFVAGDRLTRRPDAERTRLRSRKIGMVPRPGSMLNQSTFYQNLLVAMALSGIVHRAKAGAILREIGLSHRADSFPEELFPSEVARANIGLALINDPIVVVANEPTAGLESTSETAIITLLRGRTAIGKGVVVMTERLAIVAAASRVLRLRDGRLQSN